jgi:hypothetical protein
VGTCRSDAKGEVQVEATRDERTDAEHRGGAARSRDEGPVMGLDQRGLHCSAKPRGQLATGRAPGRGKAVGGLCQWQNIESRVKREFHARFWECLGTWSYRHPGQNSLYPSGADARNGGADSPNPTLSGRTRFSVFLSCQPMVLAKEACTQWTAVTLSSRLINVRCDYGNH